MEERVFHPQHVAVADRPPDDPPQHIATAIIGRQYTIANQETAGADMIGDHLQRVVAWILGAGQFRRTLDQVFEQVDFVIVGRALHDRGHALKTHAGIDRRFGQRRHLAIGGAVELHEHEVPDLDIAIALFVGRAGWTTAYIRAVIIKNFTAGPAGPGVAHRPEIFLHPETGKARRVHTDVVEPDVGRLVVFFIDGDPKTLGRQLHVFRQEFPGVFDRFLLEVIAETEIAQHFEKSVMPRRITYVFQVVVLAAGAHAALRTDRRLVAACFLAGKHVLELHHAGIGKQQCRIVAGHQRTAGYDLVALAGEKIEERLSELRAVHCCPGLIILWVVCHGRRRADLLVAESAMLQETRLACLLLITARCAAAKFPAPHIAGQIPPVHGQRHDRCFDQCCRHAALPQLHTNPYGSLATLHATVRITFREAPVTLQALCAQPVDDRLQRPRLDVAPAEFGA